MRKYEIQEDGSRKQIGAIIRRKGDTYLVDCNVTGSLHSIDSDPTFPLDKLFREAIFPWVHGMVDVGKKFMAISLSSKVIVLDLIKMQLF
eukprot:13767893-Ditylum_brightwellii.AAC.2